jgi:hypothetical protein
MIQSYWDLVAWFDRMLPVADHPSRIAASTSTNGKRVQHEPLLSSEAVGASQVRQQQEYGFRDSPDKK